MEVSDISLAEDSVLFIVEFKHHSVISFGQPEYLDFFIIAEVVGHFCSLEEIGLELPLVVVFYHARPLANNYYLEACHRGFGSVL